MPKNNESLLADMLDFTQYIAACASTSSYEGDMIEKIRDLQPRIKSAILAASGGVPAPALPVVPEGYKIVPMEPTDEMLKAPSTIIQAHGAKLIYQRMLAAAPELPEGNQQPQAMA